MFLSRSQLAKWCIDNKEPLPKFWFSDDDKHPYDISDDNLLEEMSASGRYKVMLLYDDAKKTDSVSVAKQSNTATVSSNAIKAAKAKHARTNVIKERFINFYLTEGSRYSSKTATANHFFGSMNKRERLLFNSRETATRAFLDALRKHEKQVKSP